MIEMTKRFRGIISTKQHRTQTGHVERSIATHFLLFYFIFNLIFTDLDIFKHRTIVITNQKHASVNKSNLTENLSIFFLIFFWPLSTMRQISHFTVVEFLSRSSDIYFFITNKTNSPRFLV